MQVVQVGSHDLGKSSTRSLLPKPLSRPFHFSLNVPLSLLQLILLNGLFELGHPGFVVPIHFRPYREVFAPRYKQLGETEN